MLEKRLTRHSEARRENLLFNRNGSLDKQIPRAAEQRRPSE